MRAHAYIYLILVYLLLCLTYIGFAQTVPLSGTVRDPSGSPVKGAEVRIIRNGRAQQVTQTDVEGNFSIDVEGTLEHKFVEVESAGFMTYRQSAELGHFDIVLQVGERLDQIVVTPQRSETAIADIPSTVSVVSAKSLDSTAALTIDDKLKQVPGFSLFRRTGSRVANPTSQGVSLRGIGASGASRALVLYDDVPLNDPFGGWVFWNRVSPLDVRSAELVSGGGSQLYGSGALGGVINFLPAPNDSSSLVLDSAWGTERSPYSSVRAVQNLGRSFAVESGSVFTTKGYQTIADSQRGSVDRPSTERFGSGNLRLGRSFGSSGYLFGTGEFYNESRGNGTTLQANSTRIGQGTFGFNDETPLGRVDFRFYGTAERYSQSFSTIAADRNSELLNRTQLSPAQQLGFSSQLNKSIGGKNLITAGVDLRSVRGITDELAYAGGPPTTRTIAGGHQQTVGVFGQDVIALHTGTILTLTGRLDHWRNYDASNQNIVLKTGVDTANFLTPRSENAFSPRIGLVQHLAHGFSLTFSAYQAFRAPTLNELYRSFRLGNVMTLANDQLTAEHLSAGEAGLNYTVGKVSLRLNGFWMRLHDPVANRTLSTTPALITRQRQNLGASESKGIEAIAETRLTSNLTIAGAYQYTDSTVFSFFADPTLIGKWIPQVPRHTLTAQVRYAPTHWNFSLQTRASSQQFDDDQNLLPLASYFVADAYVSRELKRRVEVYAAIENLFDHQVQVARTPIPTYGSPTIARAGMRLTLGNTHRN